MCVCVCVVGVGVGGLKLCRYLFNFDYKLSFTEIIDPFWKRV